jgi:hypothetical protein
MTSNGLFSNWLLIPHPLLLGAPRRRGARKKGGLNRSEVTEKLGAKTMRLVFPPFASCTQEEKGTGDEEVR